jgi:hypothetical protein
MWNQHNDNNNDDNDKNSNDNKTMKTTNENVKPKQQDEMKWHEQAHTTNNATLSHTFLRYADIDESP